MLEPALGWPGRENFRVVFGEPHLVHNWPRLAANRNNPVEFDIGNTVDLTVWFVMEMEGGMDRRFVLVKKGGANLTFMATEEIERMFLGGVEVVARQSGGDDGERTFPEGSVNWKRSVVAPGVELHLREGLPRLDPAKLRQLLEQVLNRCLG